MTPGETVTFLSSIYGASGATTCTPYIYWYKADRTTASSVSANKAGPAVTADAAWLAVQLTAVVPSDAYYCAVRWIVAAGTHYLDK